MGLVTRWRGPSDVTVIRSKYRKAISKTVVEGIRFRVSRTGQGGDGPLKGYSKNPLKMQKGPKPRLTPARGWGSYHPGGYKQYRQEVGLVSDIFVFSNKGAAWKDWRSNNAETGPLAFGFTNSLNNMAADAAVENDRLDMFDLDDKLADQLVEDMLEEILTDIYGK
jgi:hypothetical protein